MVSRLLFWIKKHTWYAAFAVVAVVVIVTALVTRNGAGVNEVIVVERRDLFDNVQLSGTVEARVVSDLGFEVSGLVQSIFVGDNDFVERGTPLVSLSLGTLTADLQSARADVALRRAEMGNEEVNLENAWSELLSADLVAKPQSSTYEQIPPIISGRYVGEEGTYKFRITAQNQSGKFNISVFDLEFVDEIEIEKTGPTPLGTRGLFVSFPDRIELYKDTTWYVTLPNREKTSYAKNYNMFDNARAALRTLQEGESIVEAQLKKAQAEVARIEAQIAQRTLRAPFSGIVSKVHINPGESISANTPVVSLISVDGFGVKLDLPEVDIVKVQTGQMARITLDALGESEEFIGKVASVNRVEKLIDNIAVYEARVAFEEKDSRIVSGMTARVTITTKKREQVLAVPVRSIKYHEDGTAYVLLREIDSKIKETDVILGMRSSDSFFEIIEGLSEGSQVLIPA
jgi:RND family efflux transporter MFP subunit